jgi:hypothetical protein
MKWPDRGYTRRLTVVDISEVLPSPNHPSEPIIHHYHASSQSGNDPSILDLMTQEKLVALSQKPGRLLFKQLLLTKIGLKYIKSQICTEALIKRGTHNIFNLRVLTSLFLN